MLIQHTSKKYPQVAQTVTVECMKQSAMMKSPQTQTAIQIVLKDFQRAQQTLKLIPIMLMDRTLAVRVPVKLVAVRTVRLTLPEIQHWTPHMTPVTPPSVLPIRTLPESPFSHLPTSRPGLSSTLLVIMQSILRVSCRNLLAHCFGCWSQNVWIRVRRNRNDHHSSVHHLNGRSVSTLPHKTSLAKKSVI